MKTVICWIQNTDSAFKGKKLKSYTFITIGFALTLFTAAVASAWTGPTGTPPNNNAAAPINVSATAQVKNGNIAVNGLAVFGNTLLGGTAGSNAFLNFGATAGSGGYGFWDNGGTLNYKNSGGSWQPFNAGGVGGTGTANYVPRFTGATTLANSSITSDGSSATSNGNLFITGNLYPGVISNTGGGTWFIGPGAWAGAISGADSVTGIFYGGSGSTGSQLLTLGSGPGQASLELDGSVFVGGGSPVWDPFSLTAASNGSIAVNNNAEVGGQLAVKNLAAFSSNVIVNSGSNPVYFTSTWGNNPNNATNIAEISNDTNTYKTLMIVGNRSKDGSTRSVSVWDQLNVNGSLCLNGTCITSWPSGSGVNNDTLDTVTGRGSSTGNAITIGGATINGNVNLTTSNNIGVNGKSATSGYPSGWAGGVHTYDLYAEGTVGAGPSGGPAAAYFNNAGTVSATQYCFSGGNCISSWPSGGGSGTVGGTGTTNYIPRWTNTTTLGNSTIADNGTSATATGNFFVSGNEYISGGLAVQNSLNVSGNQVWNSSGLLYLQWGAPANSNVQIGDGSHVQDLTIPNGRIGVAGKSPSSGLPSGWWGGLHTLDVYAEGTIGIGTGGAVKASMSNTGTVNATQYCINGANCITSWPTGGGSQIAGVVTYMAAGSGNVQLTGAANSAPYVSGSTLVLPSNTSAIEVEIWGGGGGGNEGSQSTSGSGGGGGGYASNLYTSPASSYSFTIGAGGTTAVTTAGAGGNSTFSGGLTANGGAGANYLNGGVGGTASGGSENFTGSGGVGTFSWASGSFSLCIGTGGSAPRGGGGGACTNPGAVPGGGGGSGYGGNGASGGIAITVYMTSTSGADYAEMYPVESPLISSGDIVAIGSTSSPITLKLATAPFGTSTASTAPLIGVVSTAPGQVVGDQHAVGERPIALMGRVPVKVNLEGGMIASGDRIAASSVPGVGKKAGPFDDSIGTALSSYDGTQSSGEVTVFLDNEKGLDRSSVAGAVIQLFGDASNVIHDVYADVIHANEVDTQTLCVSDSTGAKTCVTKAQLDKLLSAAAVN